MLLPEASDIEAGTSILFLGAGFSAEATNINGEDIKDTLGLISYLLGKVGITSSEGYDLDAAADEFQQVHGDEATVAALHSNFRVKVIKEEQAIIVCQPWRRIYTSNYDDVIETICTDNRKPITTKEVNEPVSQPMRDTTQLIHIYGNISKASPDQFAETFLLTERQRDNSPFLKSPWMRRFHDDVLAASSVIFVGFSMTDIDLRRLLGMMPPEVIRKVHFVVRPATLKPILNRMNRLGTAHPIGLSALAARFAKKRPGAPVKTYSAVPVALQEMFFSPKLATSVSSKDIESLFVSGDIDIKKLSQADVSADPGSYTISRSRNAYARAGNNATGSVPILVSSDIGNGKTVFANQVGYYYAQKNYRVFQVQREPENIGDILAYFEAMDEPTLVIFDDLMRFRALPTAILELRRSNIIVLATIRTGLLDTVPHSIKARIGNLTAIEINLDMMLREEAVRTLQYLDVNGLLGRFADLSDKERLDFIEKKCGGQLRDIVLNLYETGALQKKVEQLLINIQRLDKGAQDLIIFSATLTQAGFQELSQLSLLADILDYSGVFEDLHKALAEHELNSLVRLGAGDIAIRSPTLAEFILKRVFSIEIILDVVKRGLKAIHSYYADEDDLVRMAKGLLKFSVYGRIIKGNRENEIIERFYDDCRLLSFAADDPLFWVQRSICNMNSNAFEISFRYVENAYGLARKRKNWDTFQIDNHLARLLLIQSREQGVSENGEREQRAQSLLQSVLARKSDDLYHPLSVMRLYAEIVDKYASVLSPKQKVALGGAIAAAISSIARFKHAGRFRNIAELRTRLVEAGRRLT